MLDKEMGHDILFPRMMHVMSQDNLHDQKKLQGVDSMAHLDQKKLLGVDSMAQLQ